MSTAGKARLQPHCPNSARDLLARLGRLLPRWYSHPTTRATHSVELEGGSVHLNLGVAPPVAVAAPLVVVAAWYTGGSCCVCLLCNRPVDAATSAVAIAAGDHLPSGNCNMQEGGALGGPRAARWQPRALAREATHGTGALA